jgi:hypothetical protein
VIQQFLLEMICDLPIEKITLSPVASDGAELVLWGLDRRIFSFFSRFKK